MSVHERFEETDRFFAGTGKVHTTLKTLTAAFEQMDIDYAVIGAMALNAHGYHRVTTNVDVLVSRNGFEYFSTQASHLGFVTLRERPRRAFQDTGTGVAVDFFLSGEFPGDGKSKPVAFPNPALVATEIEGVKVVDLPMLINLKLASGMSAPHRRRDLSDIQDLIRILRLGADFADRVDPYVRTTFMTLLKELDSPDPHIEGHDLV